MIEDTCEPKHPHGQRGSVSERGRERRVSVKLLVVAAVGIAVVLMATLTAQAVVARTTCNNHPLLINVAVSDDISPAVQRVGQYFNRQSHQVDGRCVEVQVTEAPPATVAAQVDGQAQQPWPARGGRLDPRFEPVGRTWRARSRSARSGSRPPGSSWPGRRS